MQLSFLSLFKKCSRLRAIGFRVNKQSVCMFTELHRRMTSEAGDLIEFVCLSTSYELSPLEFIDLNYNNWQRELRNREANYTLKKI